MMVLGGENNTSGGVKQQPPQNSKSTSPPLVNNNSTDWTSGTSMFQYEDWLCQFEKEGMPAEVVKHLMEGMRLRKTTPPTTTTNGGGSLNQSNDSSGIKRTDKQPWGTLSSFIERDGTRQLTPFGDSTSTNHSSYLGETSAYEGGGGVGGVGLISNNNDALLECDDDNESNLRNGDTLSKGLVYSDINRLRTLESMEHLNGWMKSNGNAFDNYPRSFHPPHMNNSVVHRRQTPSARSAIKTPNGFYSGSVTPRPNNNNNNSQYVDTYSNYVPPDLEYLVVNHQSGEDSISVRRSSRGGARSNLDNGRVNMLTDNIVDMQRRIDTLQHQVDVQESRVSFLTDALSRLYPQFMEEHHTMPLEVHTSQNQMTANNGGGSGAGTGGWNDLSTAAAAAGSNNSIYNNIMTGLNGNGGGYFAATSPPMNSDNNNNNNAYSSAALSAATVTTAAGNMSSSSSNTNTNQSGTGNVNMGSLTRNSGGVQIPKNNSTGNIHTNTTNNNNNDAKNVASRLHNITSGSLNTTTTTNNNSNCDSGPGNTNNNSSNGNKNSNNITYDYSNGGKQQRRHDHHLNYNTNQHQQQHHQSALSTWNNNGGGSGGGYHDTRDINMNSHNYNQSVQNNNSSYETDRERNKREIATLELAENNKVVIHVKTDNFNELQVREEMHMRCPGITDEIVDVNVYDKSKTLILTYLDARSAQTASQTLQGHLRKIAHAGSPPSELIKSVGLSKPPIIRDLRAYSQRIKERYYQYPIVVYAEMPVLGKVFPEGRKQLHSYRLEWAAEAKRRNFDMKGNNKNLVGCHNNDCQQGFDHRKDAVIVFMSREPGGVFECYLEEIESRQIKQKLVDNDQWPTSVK